MTTETIGLGVARLVTAAPQSSSEQSPLSRPYMGHFFWSIAMTETLKAAKQQLAAAGFRQVCETGENDNWSAVFSRTTKFTHERFCLNKSTAHQVNQLEPKP
jgi:hypothetical protein